MARRANKQEAYDLAEAINSEPGRKGGFFARLFGWHREKVSRHLATLNDDDVLFYEDDYGRLYPFNPNDLS